MSDPRPDGLADGSSARELLRHPMVRRLLISELAATMSFGVLTAALGWQAVTVVTVVTAAIRMVIAAIATPSNRSLRALCSEIPTIVPVVAAQIICWRPILEAWRHLIWLTNGF